MIDIVFPHKNEKRFVETALKLGFDKIAFVYNDIKDVKGIQSKDIDIFYGILSNNSNKINKVKNKVDFIISDSNNKQLFRKIDLIFNLENQTNRDFMHQRNSGLNHVLAKELKQRTGLLGLSFNLILNSKNKIAIIGRIAQNIRLCQKYKVGMIIGSFAQNPEEMRGPEDLIAFFNLLGLNNGKKAITNLHRKIKQNHFKNSDKYVTEGVYIE